MKYYIFVLLVILLSACSTNPKNNIDLFNGNSFKLNSNEKESQITTGLKNSYLDFIKEKEIQIPLFKSIKNSNYVIFIGLPVNTSASKLFETSIFNDSLLLTSKTDNSSYDFKKYKNGNQFISEYSANIQDNLVYILTITDSENVSDSLFNFGELSSRLQSNNSK